MYIQNITEERKMKEKKRKKKEKGSWVMHSLHHHGVIIGVV